MLFPSTLELESGGHTELEIYREAYNAKMSLLESCETWAADIASTGVIFKNELLYKHSGNITYNYIIAKYNNIYVDGTREVKENIIEFVIAPARIQDLLG